MRRRKRRLTTCTYCKGRARAVLVMKDWRPMEFVSCYDCWSDYVRIPKEPWEVPSEAGE